MRLSRVAAMRPSGQSTRGSTKLDRCHTKTSSALEYILMSLVLPFCHTIVADVIVEDNWPYNTKREGCLWFGPKYCLR